MPHSLKVRLKNLKHQGLLSEKDVERLISALEQMQRTSNEVKKHVGNTLEDAVSREAVLDLFYDLDNLYERIKALPPVIPKIGEDAISRADAKEIIARNDKTDGTVPIFTGKIVQQMLDSLPSVTRQTKSHKEKVTHHKCKECQWLANEKTVIGRKCVNPHKVWRSRTAMWHQPSCKACKMFKPYKAESEDKE